MKKVLLFLFTAILFVGCFGQKKDLSTQLIGNTYYLQGVVEDSVIDITFEKERLGGSSGVNRYFGEYKLDGNKISIQNPGSTKMMGPPDLMTQEDTFLKNITESDEIKVTEEGILIKTKSGVELNFVKK
ncbi:MAG: META domain-containing protein [Cetobacterium sp.]